MSDSTKPLPPGSTNAEEQLRKSASLLRATLDSTVNGILVIDRAGKVVEWNRRFAEMWRMPREVMESSDDEQLLPWALRQLKSPEQFLGKVRHLYDHPDEDSHDFLDFQDGRVFERWSLPQWLDGEVIGRVWSFLDITDRKRLEAEFLQAQKMEAIGQLAGGVAHDFNNLLSAVLGYSELLLMRLAEDDPHRREVGEIRKAAERGASLTRQLLAYSRRQVMESRVVDLNDLVSRLTELLRRVIGEDIELILELAQRPGRVEVDPAQMEHALMNLAVNARDAMPSGGKLILCTASQELDAARAARLGGLPVGSYVCLTVTDTGTGMDEGTRARIFEPFYTTKAAGKGTGLGLAMVQGVVQQSGGHIEVISSPGRGTTFRILIPSVDASLSHDPELPTLESPDPLPGGSILLAEDEQPLRSLIAEALGLAGYEVSAAGSGSEALEMASLRIEPPDLLLTDVIMPDMNGLELCQRLRERWPDLKVLYISGYSGDSMTQLQALETRANYLQKPFGPEPLRRKVGEVLRASRARIS